MGINKYYAFPEAKQVIISGDIHGDFKTLVFKLCVQYGCTDTLLIVAGDCGFGFEKPAYYEQIYNQVVGRLRKSNNWIVFIRGNHDDPSYFREEKISYRRWRAVPDYSVIQACGHQILCVGGAISIDRRLRKEWNENLRERGLLQTACWWADEAPVFNPDAIDFLPVEIQIDTVVTHTAPSFCELTTKRGLLSWAVDDPVLIDDVDEERKAIDTIQKRLLENDYPVSRWFYGHFHQSWCAVIDGIEYTMLDIMEFKEVGPRRMEI